MRTFVHYTSSWNDSCSVSQIHIFYLGKEQRQTNVPHSKNLKSRCSSRVFIDPTLQLCFRVVFFFFFVVIASTNVRLFSCKWSMLSRHCAKWIEFYIFHLYIISNGHFPWTLEEQGVKNLWRLCGDLWGE